MKIAVLYVATNLKIRIKVGNVSLLKQDEKKTAVRLFDELDLWIRNSDYEIVPVVITCYNEIYEIAVKKHFLAFNNIFGFISEGNTIRYGIASYPDADAYFVISANEDQFFRAEIFEGLCNRFKNNPDKTIISRYDRKITLPMIFTRQFLDHIRSVKNSDDGKFILYSTGEETIYFDITDEIISDDIFHKAGIAGGRYPDSDFKGKDDYAYMIPSGQVAVIRGGGRLATAVALALHQFGYRVLITEIQNPTTLYTGMSFAQAIYTSEAKIEGISAFLVTPGKIQIQKAWNSNAIPIIIDPDCEVLQLFNQITGKDSLQKENLYNNSSMGRKDYLNENSGQPEDSPRKKQETTKDKVKSFLDQNRLTVLIDATSSIILHPTTINMAPVTIGLRDDQCAEVDVHYKIRTDLSSQYGKIICKREIEIIHISQTAAAAALILQIEEETGSSKYSDSAKKDKPQPVENERLNIIYSPDTGIYKGNRNIGDEIDKYSIIGYIENFDGKKTDILASTDGRLIANAPSESYHNIREAIAITDSSGITKDDCFQSLPIDKAVAYSILSVLKIQKIAK